MPQPLNFDDIRQNREIAAYIRKADESLIALGYTEHSFAHVGRVADLARRILLWLGHDPRTAELAAIAGWLHDIGNVVNRIDHAQSGAVMAFRILDKLGFAPDETATVITAIGNHDEGTAFPVNAVAAALIIADKTDVRANRVRNQDMASFDIHDRVNYSVKQSEVLLEPGVIRENLVCIRPVPLNALSAAAHPQPRVRGDPHLAVYLAAVACCHEEHTDGAPRGRLRQFPVRHVKPALCVRAPKASLLPGYHVGKPGYEAQREELLKRL